MNVDRIEAVTVCVGYDDFLNETARWNRGLLDRWVVVTTPSDKNTIHVCQKFDLQVIITNDFYAKGDKFNKGRGVNRGLNMLTSDSWRLHIDADIVLPHTFRHQLDTHPELNRNNLYGVDRLMVPSAAAWKKFTDSDALAREWNTLRLPFPLGARWAAAYTGYVPIGFFQLWHASSDEYRGLKIKRYPETHGSACRSDVQFSLQWDRSQRHLIPDLFVYHLDTGPSKLGANWDGRTTPRFAPTRSGSPSIIS
jgi:hypothetical protein